MDSADARPARRVPHIATYRRELPVGLERLYENAIDWEHLPFLHRTSFSRIDCHDAGAWGFRARLWPPPYDERRSFVIELKLDRDCRRWITSTLEGPGAGTEIWTHAFELGKRRTLVVVDFFVPGAEDERAVTLAEYYRALYALLYDEDVAMMTERQAQLDLSAQASAQRGPERVTLGLLDKVRASLPLEIEFAGRSFRIIELDGELIAHAAVCPHRLGPLCAGRIERGVIECPWHGYRFDLRTRRCVSGANLDLPPAPRVRVDPRTSEVILESPGN
jgi:phenylpropionate dioxygenase-like ring-hydroxylating dioxygenase large terminal subunit